MKLNKKYTMYLIHHSHTDIGYTDTQERALMHQADFIHHLLAYYENDKNLQDFKWNCETFVAVEEFLKTASKNDVDKFIKYIKEGKIELSANFSNTSEILDPSIMERMIKRAVTFGKEIGYDVKCAMQADVNGFGLGYANALANAGVEFFMTLVHTHHGMYPIFKKQAPFVWKMPTGKKILVWSGEHYMFGNAFGFAEGAIAQYGFGDNADIEFYNKNPEADWTQLVEGRFEKYINQLEKDDYKFDFFPACIQGKFTDNAMPNPSIIGRVKKWNEKYGSQVEVKMVTLSEFYEVLKKKESEIEVLEGDWPDWWTDGTASAPRELKIFKNTQTKYEILQKLDKDRKILTEEKSKAIDYDLALYAEHTYGAWSSISNPYDSFANESWAGKQWYAFNAMRNVDRCYIELENYYGSCSSKAIRSSKFKIVNPNNSKIQEVIQLPFHGADALSLDGHYKIYDTKNNSYEYFCTQWGNYPVINVTLEANEEKNIIVEFNKEYNGVTLNHNTYSRYQLGGTDNVDDCYYNTDILKGISPKNIIVTENYIENNFYKISWSKDGIYSWFDKELKEELLDKSNFAFTPIYEVTKGTPRNQMGRNRKGIDVQRDFGIICKVKKLEQTPFFVKVSLTYKVDGTSNYENVLTIFRDVKRIDVGVKIAKDNVLEPENLYIALPFKKEKLYMDKKNSIIIPREYQLPGTLADFYATYDGLGFTNKNFGIAVSTPDTHLIQYGDLEFRERVLSGDPKLKDYPENVYVWAMNNIWETNFIANLGNFYEFRYSVSSSKEFSNSEKVIDYVRTVVKKPLVINAE